MNLASIPLGDAAFFVIAFGMVGSAIYFLLRKRTNLREAELIGATARHEIRIVRDESWSGMVGMVWIGDRDYVDICAALTSSQALLLAQWLRLAAASGRNLAQARMNLRRSAAPAAPHPGPPR